MNWKDPIQHNNFTSKFLCGAEDWQSTIKFTTSIEAPGKFIKTGQIYQYYIKLTIQVNRKNIQTKKFHINNIYSKIFQFTIFSYSNLL